MFKELIRCAALLLTLSTVGCADADEPTAARYPVPQYCDRHHFLPIWIIEADPNVSLGDRKDLDRDRGIAEMLVIPVYSDYGHEGVTDRRAIAHPFLCHPGEEIEGRLRSFGQREKVAELIVWARGYFPSSIGGNFIFIHAVNGEMMIVKELQRCLGSEEAEIDAAMKDLLSESEFVVGHPPQRPSVPDTNEVITVDFHYDAAQVVRSTGYAGRFFQYGLPRRDYSLWGYDVGTKIVNRFSGEEKKMVADFAAGGHSNKSAERPSHTNHEIILRAFSCAIPDHPS